MLLAHRQNAIFKWEVVIKISVGSKPNNINPQLQCHVFTTNKLSLRITCYIDSNTVGHLAFGVDVAKWCDHSLFSHDLEVLKSILSCRRLSILASKSWSIADRHWQCRQLDKTLATSSHWLLFNIHISDFKRLFRCNLLQKLDKIEILIVQGCHLLQEICVN